MCFLWKGRDRRAFDEIFVSRWIENLRNSFSFLVSSWCIHEVPVCIEDWVSFVENHIMLVNCLLFGVLLFSLLMELFTLSPKKKKEERGWFAGRSLLASFLSLKLMENTEFCTNVSRHNSTLIW